jgi:predicted methyltransferase
MKGPLVCALALWIICGETAACTEIPGYVARAVANRSRSSAERDADRIRLPAQTIAFAGVAPGMVIAEFIPFYGYFTRLLCDVVGPKGRVYGIENLEWSNTAFDKQLKSERRNIFLQRTKLGEFDLPEKIDVFWITQNYHDLHVTEYGHVDVAGFNRRVFDALKPGGLYLIVDQAADPGTTEERISILHRIDEAQVIREVTAAGFVLVDESDALRHPKDDRTRSIFDSSVSGHTDEFMLKFQKPDH